MEPSFGIGDKVKIVNYGHKTWRNHETVKGKIVEIDLCPKVVGKEGIVDEVIDSGGKTFYGISGIPEKHSWYNEGQMELISKNPNIS